MALLAIQLARVLFACLAEFQPGQAPPGFSITFNVVIIIHQALNVIIRFVHFYIFYFTDSIHLLRGSHQQ